MRLRSVEKTWKTRAALVRHQRDVMAALHKLGRQRMRRNHVAAGAAGGENEMPGDAGNAPAHLPLHFTT
jgi:hypothetical protein